MPYEIEPLPPYSEVANGDSLPLPGYTRYADLGSFLSDNVEVLQLCGLAVGGLALASVSFTVIFLYITRNNEVVIEIYAKLVSNLTNYF